MSSAQVIAALRLSVHFRPVRYLAQGQELRSVFGHVGDEPLQDYNVVGPARHLWMHGESHHAAFDMRDSVIKVVFPYLVVLARRLHARPRHDELGMRKVVKVP